jgi:nitrous oxide reductase accessory protein NosL
LGLRSGALAASLVVDVTLVRLLLAPCQAAGLAAERCKAPQVKGEDVGVEKNLISGQPDPRGQFVLTAITNPPQFTADPRQLRVLFSPALGVYVPLR